MHQIRLAAPILAQIDIEDWTLWVENKIDKRKHKTFILIDSDESSKAPEVQLSFSKLDLTQARTDFELNATY